MAIDKSLKDLGIIAKDYLCFKDETLIDGIKNINLIIGKNNSGKTAFTDVIRNCCTEKSSNSNIRLKSKLSNYDIERVFKKDTSGGEAPINMYENHYEYGKKFIGEEIIWPINKQKLNISANEIQIESIDKRLTNYIMFLGRNMVNPLEGKEFVRISSERDIKPEEWCTQFDENGLGITGTISKIQHSTNYDMNIIDITLLEEINKILKPDITFKIIKTRTPNDKKWEIFFEEEEKGLVPLSRTGSGLKTVISIAACLHLKPYLAQKELKDYIFAFEELENNLHPSIIRRLFLYIKKFSKNNDCIFFITTHSNLIIDLFSKDENAQIIHIENKNGKSHASKAIEYSQFKYILYDLDVRASDILQSNCIVWLEGPSDRIYFNKWIELFSECQLQEGYHYQCVFYGGKLLYHLTAKENVEAADEFVEILKVNTNAIIIMDSDKKSDTDGINNTKERILKEINEVNGYGWITEGKEIENYLTKNAFEKYFNENNQKDYKINDIGQYELVSEYLKNNIDEESAESFNRNKVTFASKVVDFLAKEELENKLDLKTKIEEVIKKIKEWNHID